MQSLDQSKRIKRAPVWCAQTLSQDYKFLQLFTKDVVPIRAKQIAVGIDSLAKELELYSTDNCVVYPRIAKMEISRIIIANVNFAILILKSFLKVIASPILDITKPSAVDMDVPPPVNGAYKLGIANQWPIRATRATMNEILAPR